MKEKELLLHVGTCSISDCGNERIYKSNLYLSDACRYRWLFPNMYPPRYCHLPQWWDIPLVENHCSSVPNKRGRWKVPKRNKRLIDTIENLPILNNSSITYIEFQDSRQKRNNKIVQCKLHALYQMVD